MRYEAYGVIVYTRNALAITRAIQSHILFAKRREPSKCNNTARLDTCVLAIGSHICARVRTRVRVYEHMTCVLAIGSHTYIYIYVYASARTRVCMRSVVLLFPLSSVSPLPGRRGCRLYHDSLKRGSSCVAEVAGQPHSNGAYARGWLAVPRWREVF